MLMQGRWDDADAEGIAHLDKASDANAKTHYNPVTNRCHVEVDVGTINVDREVYEDIHYLYDGQTREMLAFYSTRGRAIPTMTAAPNIWACRSTAPARPSTRRSWN